MGRTFAAVFVLASLITAQVACSSVEPAKKTDCSEYPNAKGCKCAASSPDTSSTSTPMTTPTTLPPPPVVVDAGADAARPRKPDGGTPQVPQPDLACRDLLNCCARVRDSIERAACYGVGYNASASTCANAIIAYQVFGGCNHSEWELPDIFNADGGVNEEKDCAYLEQYCYETGDCAGYDQCNGVPLPSGGGTYDPGSSGDLCSGLSDVPDSCGRSPYLCCMYEDPFYCEEYGSQCENQF